MESSEAALPAEEREGTSGQEPGGERGSHHRETKLPAVRHDDASAYKQHTQAGETGEGGSGVLQKDVCNNDATVYLYSTFFKFSVQSALTRLIVQKTNINSYRSMEEGYM